MCLCAGSFSTHDVVLGYHLPTGSQPAALHIIVYTRASTESRGQLKEQANKQASLKILFHCDATFGKRRKKGALYSAASARNRARATGKRPDWTGPDWTGPDRTRPDRTGPDRTGPDRTGQDRTGLDRTGPDRTGFARSWFFGSSIAFCAMSSRSLRQSRRHPKVFPGGPPPQY